MPAVDAPDFADTPGTSPAYVWHPLRYPTVPKWDVVEQSLPLSADLVKAAVRQAGAEETRSQKGCEQHSPTFEPVGTLVSSRQFPTPLLDQASLAAFLPPAQWRDLRAHETR
ncbi:hypothetical protein D3C71_1226910 [compost metagenome]